jgi:hypothetical protein
MTAMALDPAGGGRDSAEIAPRHGGWYAPLISAKGAETADGSATAATVVKHRRDRCPVVVDVGGGYGGAVILRLKDNEIEPAPFNGANTVATKTKDKQLSFANKRAEAHWRFREALDPDQEGGSDIALPPDPELRDSDREQGRASQASRALSRQGRRSCDVLVRGNSSRNEASSEENNQGTAFAVACRSRHRMDGIAHANVRRNRSVGRDCHDAHEHDLFP